MSFHLKLQFRFWGIPSLNSVIICLLGSVVSCNVRSRGQFWLGDEEAAELWNANGTRKCVFFSVQLARGKHTHTLVHTHACRRHITHTQTHTHTHTHIHTHSVYIYTCMPIDKHKHKHTHMHRSVNINTHTVNTRCTEPQLVDGTYTPYLSFVCVCASVCVFELVCVCASVWDCVYV